MEVIDMRLDSAETNTCVSFFSDHSKSQIFQTLPDHTLHEDSYRVHDLNSISRLPWCHVRKGKLRVVFALFVFFIRLGSSLYDFCRGMNNVDSIICLVTVT